MRIRMLELGVGAFLLVGLLALSLLAFSVSGLRVDNSGTYTVYAYFENASGLTARSRVSLAGVTIGQVKDIRIDNRALQALVTMEISNEVDYLSADSSAAVLTSGLLGEKYIGITLGAEEELLKDGGYMEDTQSALVLEDLVGKFLFNKVAE